MLVHIYQFSLYEYVLKPINNSVYCHIKRKTVRVQVRKRHLLQTYLFNTRLKRFALHKFKRTFYSFKFFGENHLCCNAPYFLVVG